MLNLGSNQYACKNRPEQKLCLLASPGVVVICSAGRKPKLDVASTSPFVEVATVTSNGLVARVEKPSMERVF